MDEDLTEHSNTQQETMAQYLARLQHEEEENKDNVNSATINPAFILHTTESSTQTTLSLRPQLPPSKGLTTWEAL